MEQQPGLRERNKQDKLRRIRDAARDLFLEKGFEATTTREVAERAGVATGTLFLYARDKQELVFLIFREEVGEAGGVIDRAFAALPAGDLGTRAAAIFGAFFDHYRGRLALSRLFVKEMLCLQGDKRDEYAGLTFGFLLRIAELVSEAQRRGEVREGAAPMAVAANFFSFYLFHLVSWMATGSDDPGPAQAALREALSLQIEGLRPRGSGGA